MDVIYDKKTMKRPIKVWGKDIIDSNTIEQAKLTASMPFVHKHISLMPDAHLGKGSTVGSVLATKKAIIPATIGVDIGCGMCAVKTDINANQLPDTLREVRMSIEDHVPVGFKHHSENAIPVDAKHIWFGGLGSVWDKTIKGLIENDKNPIGQLGTLGGGNHFIELCLDEKNAVWIMLHSGSRGIGNLIGRTFIEKAKIDMRLYHNQGAAINSGTEAVYNYFSVHRLS